MKKPIPEIREPERYIEVCFTEDKFVELTSNDGMEVEMQYPILGMDFAEKQCFVRQDVYKRLMEAAKMLPDGYKFKILDAWRPFALQKELYEKYAEEIIKEYQLENCSENQRNAVICKFVSDPVEDRIIPPVHTTGGAIDLTIIDANGMELDMGSAFDEFSDRTFTNYYEKEINSKIRDNRRMLYNIMIKAGFTNLPSEWWHYDYGDRFWAYYKKQPAFYKGAFTREELRFGKIG